MQVNPLSQTKLKFFAALRRKKDRMAEGLFLAEGAKLTAEALAAGVVDSVVMTEDFLFRNPTLRPADVPVYVCSPDLFARISEQDTPEGVLAVAKMRSPGAPPVPSGRSLFVASMQDPGNLGVLLRTADWFGFEALYAAEGTVDCYNGKTVRATMGAIFRVPVYYVPDFASLVATHAERIVVADLQGQPLQQAVLTSRDLLLLGSESHGVPDELLHIPGLLAVTIPQAAGRQAESLSVSTAAGILCYAMTQPR